MDFRPAKKVKSRVSSSEGGDKGIIMMEPSGTPSAGIIAANSAYISPSSSVDADDIDDACTN
jgi:hypothetical protein